ncbi:DUF3859 domain-containing protein [Thalassococcus sp. CAU 1522]|uniref:DUF3859 domain-containing protein n=1 Tax=Thalassococcus arenae TaxID=2851652 RepID=A0ABS6N700_9RHOB|nr:DUF3859 domain-containing protein [Thalassococcus arenae]MBV2359795.1 DUF3859 domain-containing protein [Thalassococcus arenae]
MPVRRRIAIHTLAVLAGVFSFAAAAAQNRVTDPLRLVDHGVICDVTITGRQDAPLTESGTMNLVDQGRQIDVTTRFVPMRPGLSFGLRTRLADGSAPIEADIVVTHPPMSTGTTTQSWPARMTDGATALNLFTFEHDHEMVPGLWTFFVLDRGTVLAEQGFVVGPDSSAPDVLATCFGDALTS